MSFRSPLLVILGLATVAVASCDEFPEPLNGDSGLIPITIQPINWPSELVLGGSATLEVSVEDREGRAVLDVPVSWALLQGSAGNLVAAGSDDAVQELQGSGLGWARITVSVTDQEPFSDFTLQDSIPILLAGVEIDVPAADTTLTAIGDQMVLSAAGVSQGGTTVSGTGLQWQIVSGSGVSPVSTVQADQVTIEADGEGTTVIAATHTQCVSTSPCADTVRVSVDQEADSVALSSRADTLVAEDTVQLAAEAFDANGNTAANETITWLTRNASVATVDNTGLVTAQGTGQTRILAMAATGAADSATIDVNASGVMTVDLTDAPADLLASAELFLGGVFIIDNVVNDGRRYLLDQPFSVDLLTLADTVAALAAGRVPAGTYNNLVLDVDSARITLLNAYTFSDLTRTRTFTLPGDTLLAAINGTATFADGDTVKMVLDFDVDGSFPMAEPSGGIAGEPTFDPTTRVVKRTDAASIAGTVRTTSTVAVDNLPIRAVRTDVTGDTLFTRTDAGGAFKLRYLVPGAYDLSMPRPPACHVANPALQSVAVATGQALAGSDFSIDSVTIDSVTASPAADTINAIGFTTTLGATAYQGTTALAGLGIQWSSADPSIATVDAVTGIVTAVSSGVARIAASACGSVDTALVTVRQIAASATISPENPEVDAGATQQFTATLLDSGGVAIDTATFDWTIFETDIATIDTNGLATALKSGAATVEAFHAASGIFVTTEMSVLLAPAQSFSLNAPNGCALTTTSQVACWGANPHGILGFAPIAAPDGGSDWYTPYKPQTIPLPTTETYTQVDVGSAHACALTAGGDIYCWGSGGNGELGNGSTFDSHTPVLVSRPAGETFTDVAAGDWFTCAATGSGQAYCWGANDVGQLGNGTSNVENVPAPVAQVPGLDLFDLTVEHRTVCAIGTNNAGYCWGEGHVGQLGNNTSSDSFVPVAVSMPATTFTQIVMGPDATCALGADGRPYCWGPDNFGLGGGGDLLTPMQVGSETFVTIGMSETALCGATGTGAVRCTGGNYSGQFGNGTTDRSGARYDNGATGVSALALDGGGWDTFCGLDAGGDVYCWGYKGEGTTGTGDMHLTWDPLQVNLAGAVDITSRSDHVCVLTDFNEVYCWGSWIGEFTASSPDTSSVPVPAISPPAGVFFTDIETGNDHLCALTGVGEIYCLGANYSGQLGDGTFNWSTNAWVPVPHPTGGGWDQLTTGRQFTCALDFAADIYCWGWNGNGQLGTGATTGADYPDPTQVFDVGVAYTSVNAGAWHACATTTGSAIYCWGWNGNGQLGIGGFTNQNIPTQVSTSQFFDQVSAGRHHTCGLTFGDEAYCWGLSDSGQLGDGGVVTGASDFPVQVAGGFTFDWIEAGGWETCAAQFGGAMKCWGANWDGQLGSGWTDSPSQPEDGWLGLSLVDVSMFGSTACGVDFTGNAYCTGNHGSGRTGVGLYSYEVLPVLVGGSGGN